MRLLENTTPEEAFADLEYGLRDLTALSLLLEAGSGHPEAARYCAERFVDHLVSVRFSVQALRSSLTAQGVALLPAA